MIGERNRIGPTDRGAPPRPWGIWATLGFGAIIAVVYVVVQVGVVAAWVAVDLALEFPADPEAYARALEGHGAVLSLATLAVLPPTLGLIALFAWLRQGITVRQYLALRWPGGRVMAAWLGVLVLVILATDGLSWATDRPIVPPFMQGMVERVWALPLVVVALVVGAPLLEESFFRGFLFLGFQRGALGVWGAILATSALWTVIHVQYGAYGHGVIFASGLVLGYARHRTGSLWVAIVMHAAMNLVATAEAVLVVHGL